MIFQQGAINLTALLVPGVYVQVTPPQPILNGVPTNVAGVVGTAQWGPVNAPTIAGSMQQYAQQFGAIQPRKYDMGTCVAAAMFQGANNFRCVRVTDGTDVAATVTISATDATQSLTLGGTAHVGDVLHLSVTPSGGTLQALTYTLTGGDTLQTAAVALAALVNASATLLAANIVADTPSAGVFNLHFGSVAPTVSVSVTGGSATTTLTAGSVSTLSTQQMIYASKWTGSLGNSIQVTQSAGTQANTWKVVVALPGIVPESFDNLGAGLTGVPLWNAIASAINNGVSGQRGASNIIVATAKGGTSAPQNGANLLVGGTDGVATINGTVMLGVDTVPRSGMYAMRSQGISVAALADLTDSTSWSTQVTFGLAEGIYMLAVGPVGDTISNAVSTKTSAGIDSYAIKILFGDWVYFNDTVNSLPQRLISPQGYALGLYANMTPQNSGLNKQLNGIVGTQKAATGTNYTGADIQSLVTAGIDVIASPSVGGNYYGMQTGHNASSNAAIWGDNYTRMTNYIANTINSGVGLFVGQLQSPDERRQAKITLDTYFQSLATQRLIGTASGTGQPWSVTLNDSNNPSGMVALGYQIADVAVTFLSVVEKFIINLQGGQTVQVVKQSTQPNQSFT